MSRQTWYYTTYLLQCEVSEWTTPNTTANDYLTIRHSSLILPFHRHTFSGYPAMELLIANSEVCVRLFVELCKLTALISELISDAFCNWNLIGWNTIPCSKKICHLIGHRWSIAVCPYITYITKGAIQALKAEAQKTSPFDIVNDRERITPRHWRVGTLHYISYT